MSSSAGEASRAPRQCLGLVVNPLKPRAVSQAHDLVRWLSERGVDVRVPPFLLQPDPMASAEGGPVPLRLAVAAGGGDEGGPLPGTDHPSALGYLDGCDALVVLGGDGTLLTAARYAAPRRIPMLSVRFGGFGFLAEAEPEETQTAVWRVLQGDYVLDERSMLEALLCRSGSEVARDLALNDVVITRGALSRVVLLRTETEHGLLSVYSADGVIVSTPTGSTAYSLSAGGPLVHPLLGVILVTPICPHSLNARSVLLPNSAEVKLTLESSDEAMLTLDGQVGYPVSAGDVVLVRRAAICARLISFGKESFFDRLQSRLRWGDRFSQ